MNESDRLDLSALDPLRDPARWRSVTGSTMDRVESVLRERRQDPLTLIALWSRPVLAGAAVAVALLIPFELLMEVREARAERVDRLVELSAATNDPGGPPTGADFLRALAEDGRR